MPADAAILPLFPLPLVLFPGATLPLHIFEPRYRQLLADLRDADHPFGDGRFGIVLATGGPERALPAGHVGCIAELRDATELPDGRLNVVVEGTERFALDRFLVHPAPYHVAAVTSFRDRPEPGAPTAAREELHAAAERVRASFARVARAARTIADDRDPVPPLPADDADVAFAVAAMVDFDLPTRQRLLASPSALGRLREVEALLGRATDGIERRAEVHRKAKTNGHGPHPAPGEA